MSDKDIELVTRGELEEMDDVAVQEAIEDEKVRTERENEGGALEVCGFWCTNTIDR